MKKGEAFLMGSPGGTKKHLWIVIGDKVLPTGTGVAINLSTDTNRTKGECPLTVGDHPWITENCAVSFGDALELSLQIENQIKMGIAVKFIVAQPVASPDLIARIQTIAATSSNFPKALLKYF